jgi:hypothetical protein
VFGRLCVPKDVLACLAATIGAVTLATADIAFADDLTDQVIGLTNKLKPSVNTADGKLREAINNLSQAIGQVDCTIVPQPDECISNLKGAVASLQKVVSSAPGDKSPQWTAVNTEINNLIDILSGAKPTVAATNVANNLAARLADTAKPVDTTDKTLTDALGALAKAIDKVAPAKPSPTPLLINVLGSYYGSLDDLMPLLCVPEDQVIKFKDRHKRLVTKTVQRCKVNGPKYDLNHFETDIAATAKSEVRASFGTPRYCSATQAIRAQCQGKAACLDNPTPSTLVATQICGYDPAPYAQPANKGLLISYQCVPKDSKEFPYADGFLPQQIAPSSLPVRWVLLRLGENLRIACSEPAAAAQSSTTKAPATTQPTTPQPAASP